MKPTYKELLDAVKLHISLQKEKQRLRKEYQVGTCNAEDAWSNFGKREEKSDINLRRLARSK